MHSGRKILDADGHVIEPAGIFGRAHDPAHNPISIAANTPFDACGGADLDDQWSHGFDPASYLRAMDRQGIDAAVLYPSVGLFVPFQADLEPAAEVEACEGYAQWITRYCAQAPQRLFGVGIVPTLDLRNAVALVTEAARNDLVAMMVRPNRLHGRELGDTYYDPVYDALAEHGLVLAVHEGLGVQGGPTLGADRFDGFTLRHLCSHPMEQMAALASMVIGGVFERYPTLRVAFLESGTGWLPYWLARLDDHIAWMRDTETAHLSLCASEYFARQCVISCDPEDPLVDRTVATVGADHVVWASDFPHPDAAFPDAVDEFLHHNPHLDEATLDAVLWHTPAAFYGLRDRLDG